MKNKNPEQKNDISFLKYVTDAFYSIDKDWNLVFFNKQFKYFTDKNTVDLKGKNILNEFPHFKSTAFYKNIKKSMDSQKSIRFREFYEKFNKWYEVSVYPNKNGADIYLKDVTLTKTIEEELIEYKERLDEAQNAASIGMWEWDFKRDTFKWSETQEKIYGLKPGSFSGKMQDVLNFIHPEDLGRIKSSFEKAILSKRKNKNYEEEFRIIKPDNSISWLKTKGKVYFDKGKAIRMIGVNYEITKRKTLQDSMRFISEAGKILSSSLDYEETLNSVAKTAVPFIADWCVIDMVDVNEELKHVALAHKDKNKVKLAEELRKKYPNKVREGGVYQVLKTGETLFIPLVDDAMLEEAARDAKHLKLIKEIGFTSIIMVPLKSQGANIGVITFVNSDSKRQFTDLDLQVAEELASRASIAIDNAGLYDAVKEERERLNNLVSNVPGVVWEAWGKPDKGSQRINYVSNYVEKLLGYSVHEWLSTPNFWLTIVHPDDRVRAAKEAAVIFNKGEVGTSRYRWIHKNGSPIWVEAHSYVVKDSKGVPIGMRGVTMDITENIETEARKDEFISAASHELKTPITSQKVFTQLLQNMVKKNGHKEYERYLNKIASQTDKITNLINDLLDISRMQTGKLIFNKNYFDLGQAVKELVEDIQGTADTHKIILKGKVEEKMYGDKDRLMQVVDNLLTNAIKYSPNADKVQVEIGKKKNHFIVKVRDYGIGIDKKHQNKIFEKFYRVSGDSEKTFSGLGIGLYISHQIVLRHNGEIKIESEKGKGSTFTLIIPDKK